jgi:ribosomal protein S18 acetylase RimI-like enzyme
MKFFLNDIKISLFPPNALSSEKINSLLELSGPFFLQELDGRINRRKYSLKLSAKADSIIALNPRNEFSAIGYMGIYISNARNRIAYISHFGVIEKYRGQGISQAMFFKAVDNAIISGIENVALEVDPNNLTAVKFYTKLGFCFTTSGKYLQGIINLEQFKKHNHE